MSIIRIQYASNLHLERFEKVVFPQVLKPCARYLALTGNIGKYGARPYHSFLQWVSERYDHIFYVPGPSEISSITMHTLQQHLPKNITLFYDQCSSLYVGREQFVVSGSTMNSECNKQRMRKHIDYWSRMKLPILALSYTSGYCHRDVPVWISGDAYATRSGMQNSTFCVANGYYGNAAYSPSAYVDFKVPKMEEHAGVDAELGAAASGIRPPFLT